MVQQRSRVVAAALLFAACGSSGGAPDAGVPDDAAMAVSDATDVSSDVGASAQEYCSPTWVNPAGCPAMRAAGTCTNPGLHCAYSESNGQIAVETCDAATLQWSVAVHRCEPTCPSLLMFDHPVTCEGAELPCEDDAGLTDFERASRAVDDLAVANACLTSEFSVTIMLDDGCAFAFVHGSEGDGVADCLRKVLANHRIACARSVRCLTVARSTLLP
jgi:hypothetical protein